MYKTYMYTVILYLMTMTNASISGKPATDLKTMQSRLIQWVIYTDHTGQMVCCFVDKMCAHSAELVL